MQSKTRQKKCSTSQLTLEQRAEQTQLLTAEEKAYSVLWGLPKTDDISQEKALFTAYAVLHDKFLLSDSELTFLFPVFTFEATNPDATLWCIKFLHADAERRVIYIVNSIRGAASWLKHALKTRLDKTTEPYKELI